MKDRLIILGDKEARDLAKQYRNDSDHAMWAFVTTGAIDKRRMKYEIKGCLLVEGAESELAALLLYIDYYGSRGPQDYWKHGLGGER